MLSAIRPALRFTLTWVWLMAAMMFNLMWLCSEHEGGGGSRWTKLLCRSDLNSVVITTINDAPVQLTQTRLLYFFPPAPCDVPPLSLSLSGAWSRLSSRKCCFPSDRKFCAQPTAVEVQLLINRTILRGRNALTNFWKRKKKKVRRLTLLKTTHHTAEPPLSFCILSTFKSFLSLPLPLNHYQD